MYYHRLHTFTWTSPQRGCLLVVFHRRRGQHAEPAAKKEMRFPASPAVPIGLGVAALLWSERLCVLKYALLCTTQAWAQRSCFLDLPCTTSSFCFLRSTNCSSLPTKHCGHSHVFHDVLHSLSHTAYTSWHAGTGKPQGDLQPGTQKKPRVRVRHKLLGHLMTGRSSILSRRARTTHHEPCTPSNIIILSAQNKSQELGERSVWESTELVTA